jgi:hypothetical protein
MLPGCKTPTVWQYLAQSVRTLRALQMRHASRLFNCQRDSSLVLSSAERPRGQGEEIFFRGYEKRLPSTPLPTVSLLFLAEMTRKVSETCLATSRRKKRSKKHTKAQENVHSGVTGQENY